MFSTEKSRLRNSAGGSIAASPRRRSTSTNGHRGDDPDQRRDEHRHRVEAARRRLDQGVRDAGERRARQQRARDVEARSGRLVRESSRLSGTQFSAASTTSTRQRHVDEEDPPPGERVDQPAAEERSERGGHPGQARPRRRSPGPGRPGGSWPGSARATRGSAAPRPAPCRNRAPISNSMFGASPHSTEAAVNQTTPMQEDPSPAEAVAERAAEQHESREHEQVAVDRPLQTGHVGIEVGADAAAARR